VRARHPRALTPVELQPQARLGDPRPIRAKVPGPSSSLRLRHRPPSSALGASEFHRAKPDVDHIGADLTRAALDPLPGLAHTFIDPPHPPRRPAHRPTRITGSRIPTPRLRIDPGQLSGRVDTARGVERLKDLHDPLFVLGAVV